MPNWDEIRNEWETSEITFKDLAEKHDVKDSTIRSRKNREKWQRNATEKNATQRAMKKKSVATDKNEAVKKKKKKSSSNSAEKNERYPNGHPGNSNPKNQFTKRNQAARRHGLFANYINEEQQEVIDSMQDLTIADQIWMQMEIKFSAIIRMQKIMWVNDEFDHLDKVSSFNEGMEGQGESYKVICAHERYESYIKAQARAMAEYRNLVKQYIELTDEFDERRMKLEGMQANIDKTNAEIENIKGDQDKGGGDWTEALAEVVKRRGLQNEEK